MLPFFRSGSSQGREPYWLGPGMEAARELVGLGQAPKAPAGRGGGERPEEGAWSKSSPQPLVQPWLVNRGSLCPPFDKAQPLVETAPWDLG